MKSAKSMLALAACGALLAGCATYDPYYDRYAYNDRYAGERHYQQGEAPKGERYVERYVEAPRYRYYDYEPGYYYSPYPYYVAPSIGFSLGFSTGRYWYRHR